MAVWPVAVTMSAGPDPIPRGEAPMASLDRPGLRAQPLQRSGDAELLRPPVQIGLVQPPVLDLVDTQGIDELLVAPAGLIVSSGRDTGSRAPSKTSTRWSR